jgi:hypothetical protein
MKKSSLALAAAALLATAGCHSDPLTIPSAPLGPNEKVIGQVEGSKAGAMLFQLIPIGQNGRFAEAYKQALLCAPGATRIIDPKLEETWLWFYVLNVYDFKVSGTAVGPK